MKISAIPAQVTTVEDRIAGNLSLTQLILLAIPLFLTAVILFLMPPIGKYSLYKIIIAGLLSITSGSLSIRLNDKLILDLVKLRLSFELRPRVYLYRKQPTLQPNIGTNQLGQTKKVAKVRRYQTADLTNNARIRSRRLLNDGQYSVVFQSRAGGLSVRVDTN